uniref:Phosphorylated CTD interacting factor 1 WW domain protein n=1 Tax=Pithovirus LCPAC304 TaxID=2506594 RepID=A0A481Z8S6_9VIRU|nr:MAG: phosphorylated CTD interacting factor 1 WW domain protein [Pithovirus LCPAC304]
MSLVEELEKIKALEKYKKGLFSYLTRYLCTFLEIRSKDAYRIVRKSFGSWYFDGIRNGKIVDFLPITDIVRERDLKYLFKKLDKTYEPYKPFHFVFRIHTHRGYRPTIKKYLSEKDQKVTFETEDYKYTISILQYGRLRDLYRGPPGYLNECIMIMQLRYGFIGTKNNHLSVPPSLIRPTTIELFGSPLNTCCDRYCSPFSIDKRFGSMGSFFDYTFQSGTYLANPPFIEDVMTEMSQKLVTALDTVTNVTIYVILPMWDEEAVARGLTYDAWNLLKDSDYLKDHHILGQFAYPFYDYYDNKYIPVSDVHLILLSNVETVDTGLMEDLMERWHVLQAKIE